MTENELKMFEGLKADYTLLKDGLERRIANEEKNFKRKFLSKFLKDIVLHYISVYTSRKMKGNLDKEDEMVLARLSQYLYENGIEPMEDPIGKPFDNATMNALYTKKSAYANSGDVVELVNRGFTMDGEVLLYNDVGVAE